MTQAKDSPIHNHSRSQAEIDKADQGMLAIAPARRKQRVLEKLLVGDLEKKFRRDKRPYEFDGKLRKEQDYIRRFKLTQKKIKDTLKPVVYQKPFLMKDESSVMRLARASNFGSNNALSVNTIQINRHSDSSSLRSESLGSSKHSSVRSESEK